MAEIKDVKNADLEALMTELDGVVERISTDDIALEEALALYERGVSLVKECNERLESAKRRINKLCTSAEGELIEVPFDAPLG